MLLGFLASIGSLLLQCALSQGTVVAWWSTALKGTTLATLHRKWEHGVSLFASISAGKHMDRIAVAKVLVCALLAVSPLLQRAVTTELRTHGSVVSLSTQAPTHMESFAEMNFNATINHFYGSPLQVSSQLARIVQAYTNKRPIRSGIIGCLGNCSGSIDVAGISAKCKEIRNSTFKVK